MYAFIEISDKNLDKISQLECEFKKTRKIPLEKKELKSKHLLKKDLCKLYKEQINFLTNIFKIINEENTIILLGYISKWYPFFDFVFAYKCIIDLINDKSIFKIFVYNFEKHLSIKDYMK